MLGGWAVRSNESTALSTTASDRTGLDPSAKGTVRKGMRVVAYGITRQPKSFAMAIGGSALYAVMTVASAMVVGQVTDQVVLPAIETGDYQLVTLVTGCAAIIGVGLLKAAGIVVRRLAASWTQLRLEAEARDQLAQRYSALPLSWHQQRPTGRLLSIANSDVETTWQVMAPLPFALGVVLMLAIAMGTLAATDLYLAAVALCIVPAMTYMNIRYNRRMRGPTMASQRQRATVSARAHESFDGALVVKTLGRETQETDAFAQDSHRLRDHLVDLGKVRALYDPLLEALPNIGVLAILVVGAYRVADGAVTTGEMVQFGYLLTMMAFPIRLIGFVLAELPRSVVGWERIQQVLEAEDHVAYGEHRPEGQQAAAIELDQVTYAYPDDAVGQELTQARRTAVDQVSFTVPPGRTLALVGATGAGKSTIAALMVRLADPNHGAVLLDGQPLPNLAHGAIADQSAIVFQQAFLFDDSVRDNVTLGGTFSDAQVWESLRLAQAEGFVAQLPDGLDTLLGERGTSLSGGQRQRLALARALVRKPRLLILDDATSAVDTRVEAAILQGLQAADLDTTIIVVAYRQATIALADQIVFLTEGRVTATGTHTELLAATPAYAELVQAYDTDLERQ